MNPRQSLICFFFLSLQDRNTGLINAEILVGTGTEGGNITVSCVFYFSGKRKIFCKDECKDADILIDTKNVTAQDGRYSIKYKEGTFPVSSTILNVSITDLTKSDAGRYKCGLHRSYTSQPSYCAIEIRVEDAPTSSKPNWTLQPVSVSVPATHSTLKTTQSSTPSSASPEGSKAPQEQQTTPAAGPRVLLYVGLILLVMFIVLSAAVLILCRKRATKPEESLEETEYADVTGANRVYEEIREDRHSRSPPAEMYSHAKYAKPNEVETDDYSFITAVPAQKKTEDSSSNLSYSEVDFSTSTAASLHSAPSGGTENVIYSVLG